MTERLDVQEALRILKKYKKRSRFGDIFHRITKHKGAVVGLCIMSFMLILFIVSLFISKSAVTSYSVSARFKPPSSEHLFGTDNMGRDLFLRVIYGTRYSILIGFSVVGTALICGVFLGSIAGYYGGALENLILRAADVVSSIPGLLFTMVLVTVLGQSVSILIFACAVTTIPLFVRVSRASFLTVRNAEFVEAARAIGFSDFRIIFTQILPNALSYVIVTTASSTGITILIAAQLSYLGFGVPVPEPEWGALISAGKASLNNAPWICLFPGLFIMLVVLGLNMIGDGLRDALDPKLKK